MISKEGETFQCVHSCVTGTWGMWLPGSYGRELLFYFVFVTGTWGMWLPGSYGRENFYNLFLLQEHGECDYQDLMGENFYFTLEEEQKKVGYRIFSCSQNKYRL